MVETAEKKPDNQTETEASQTPAPANTLTARLALGPTPTLAPAVNPLAPANTNVPPNAGTLAQLYGAPAKPTPAPVTPLGPAPATSGTAATEEVEPPSDMQVMAQELRANRKKTEEEIERRRTERDKSIKDAQDKMDQISKSYLAKDQNLDLKEGRMGERPKYKPLPVPEPKKTSLAEQWGSAAMIFAMLGSMMTRGHTVTALNAATAAMKGFQESDKDATTTAMKQWEAATTNMKMAYESEAKVYDDIMAGIRDARKNNKEVTKEQMDEAKALITTAATAFRDDSLLMMKEQSGMESVERLLLSRERGMATMEDLKDKANERKEKAAAAKKIADAKASPEFIAAAKAGDSATMDRILAAAGDKDALARVSNQKAKVEAAEVRGIGKKVTPELAAQFKPQWVALDKRPPGVQERKDPAVNKAFADAVDEYKAIHGTGLELDYNAKQKALLNLTSGKDAATLRSFDVVTNHLETLREAARELPNKKDARALNEWAAKLGRALGNPNVTTFDAIRQVIPTELQKAVSGAGIGTGKEREEFAQIMSTGLNKRSMEGVINAFEKLIEGQALGFANQYSRYFTIDQIFPSSVAPKIKEVIKKRDEALGIQTWPQSKLQQPNKTIEEIKNNMETSQKPINVPDNAKAFDNGKIKIWWDGTTAYAYDTGQPVDPATGQPIQ